MLLYYTLINFIILLFCQILVFKILKYRKNWHLLTIIFFFIIFFISNNNKIVSLEFINYLIFNVIILISYLIFLTLIFNESPSLYYLEKNDLNKFLIKGFVKHRIKLMQKDKLIDDNKKITIKGQRLLILSNFLSNLFFREYD